jgi:hypothetical protein
MSGPNEEQEQVRFFEVENGLDEEVVMKFHGDKYEWAPGEKLICSEDAIRHIFGYGLEDKSPAFLRIGWLNTRVDCQLKDAMRKLSKIKFRPVQQVFEMSQKRASKRAVASDRSLAGDGESSGGADADPASSATPPVETEAF